jgi:uncharacterized protein (DUF305 family)
MATLFPDRPRVPARLVASLLLAAGLGAVAALAIALPRSAPGDDSAEAGFARDMVTHHAQAVEMSFVIRDASSDDALRALAYDIIFTQSTQRGVLMGWLQQWGLPQTSSRPRMAWMPGHARMDSQGAAGVPLMHGMASDDELRRLRTAKGAAAEILYLQLMIRHHEGGVIMARAVAGLSRRADVVGLARSIDSTQRAEIAEMTAMLAQRGARPLPSLLE